MSVTQMVTKQKITAMLSVAACLILASCASPQEKEQQRQQAMQKLAGTTIEHLLDRNPETIESSMNVLTRDEMDEKLVERLQAAKVIPETVLNIRLIKEDLEKTHSSNKVVITGTKPLDDPKNPEVRFAVTGNNIAVLNGQAGAEKPFDYTVTCKLTPKMEGLARVTDLTMPGASTKTADANVQQPPKKRRRHR